MLFCDPPPATLQHYRLPQPCQNRPYPVPSAAGYAIAPLRCITTVPSDTHPSAGARSHQIRPSGFAERPTPPANPRLKTCHHFAVFVGTMDGPFGIWERKSENHHRFYRHAKWCHVRVFTKAKAEKLRNEQRRDLTNDINIYSTVFDVDWMGVNSPA